MHFFLCKSHFQELVTLCAHPWGFFSTFANDTTWPVHSFGNLVGNDGCFSSSSTEALQLHQWSVLFAATWVLYCGGVLKGFDKFFKAFSICY